MEVIVKELCTCESWKTGVDLPGRSWRANARLLMSLQRDEANEVFV